MPKNSVSDLSDKDNLATNPTSARKSGSGSPQKATKSRTKSALADIDINWSADDHKLHRALMTELEKPENAQVIFWRRGMNPITESKLEVCMRMGSVVVPDYFTQNPEAVAAKILNKINTLKLTYNKLVESIKEHREIPSPDGTITLGPLICNVPGDGPDDSTSTSIKEAWNRVLGKLPIFGRLHKLLTDPLPSFIHQQIEPKPTEHADSQTLEYGEAKPMFQVGENEDSSYLQQAELEDEFLSHLPPRLSSLSKRDNTMHGDDSLNRNSHHQIVIPEHHPPSEPGSATVPLVSPAIPASSAFPARKDVSSPLSSPSRSFPRSRKHATSETDISWTADDFKLTRLLIDELEKPENYPVVLWKRGRTDVGESKPSVCQRIAAAVIPDRFAEDPEKAGFKVYSKIVASRQAYLKNLELLKQPVFGQNPDSKEDMVCYVSADGPDESTPESVREIWDKILKRHPLFPRLHRLLYEGQTEVVGTASPPVVKKRDHYVRPSYREDSAEPDYPNSDPGNPGEVGQSSGFASAYPVGTNFSSAVFPRNGSADFAIGSKRRGRSRGGVRGSGGRRGMGGKKKVYPTPVTRRKSKRFGGDEDEMMVDEQLGTARQLEFQAQSLSDNPVPPTLVLPPTAFAASLISPASTLTPLQQKSPTRLALDPVEERRLTLEEKKLNHEELKLAFQLYEKGFVSKEQLAEKLRGM